jgi:hypothetical protein
MSKTKKRDRYDWDNDDDSSYRDSMRQRRRERQDKSKRREVFGDYQDETDTYRVSTKYPKRAY